VLELLELQAVADRTVAAARAPAPARRFSEGTGSPSDRYSRNF
jgi:hypothetical protein